MILKLGVLGGMGPLATVDFLRKLIAATPAAVDQEHMTTLVYSACHTPDRTAAIQGRGPSPLPEMIAGISVLQEAGADCVAIPCNTAHHWYPQLAAASAIPIFHIVDAACDRILERAEPNACIGILATAGTLQSQVYQARVDARGFRCITPDHCELNEFVMPAIRKIKAGDLADARQLLLQAVNRLGDRGAARIIMGCTEIPLALDGTDPGRLIDATEALACKCVQWWLERRSCFHIQHSEFAACP